MDPMDEDLQYRTTVVIFLKHASGLLNGLDLVPSAEQLARCAQRARRLTSAQAMSNTVHEIAGGTVGGVLGMTIVYPVDTIKSRYGH